MDELRGSPILFADNIVLVDKSRHGVNVKLEIWWNTLESKIFNWVGLKQSIWNVSLVKVETKMRAFDILD